MKKWGLYLYSIVWIFGICINLCTGIVPRLQEVNFSLMLLLLGAIFFFDFNNSRWFLFQEVELVIHWKLKIRI